ncbi:MAG TPA: hypothetical protein VMT71_01155 [Syntrophorhabdales bacterium]|nr:hypothetical protein [Syntrophorhabdales bacterium]
MAAAPGTGLSSSVKSGAVSVRKGKFKVSAIIYEMGPDILVAVWGGTYPHVGAVGMAQPRQSLKDPEETSATSSVFTFAGHKEDLLVKPLAEELARRLNRNAVVTAGIHWDKLTEDEIKIVQEVCSELPEKIIKKCKTRT